MPALRSSSGSAAQPHVPNQTRPRVPLADNGARGVPVSDRASFFHEDGYPLVAKDGSRHCQPGRGNPYGHRAPGGAGRTLRVTHVRPSSGVEGTTAAVNMQLIS
ncbi:hypothetical protein SUDANB105_00661 [Streptomyces sp. enrichment culture]